VGGAEAGFAEAREFVRRYVSRREGWAYPAYDAYPGGPTEALSEQDLLAFVLLNVNQQPIPTYYSLFAHLDELNALLDGAPLRGATLADADAKTIEALAQLIGVLDRPLPHVGLTKLSKVLHRKRPDLIPLYDRNIRRCYMGPGSARVPRQKGRSWGDFARVWLPEVQRDLVEQSSLWDELAALATNPGITPLRALDIVGWALGDPRRSLLPALDD
jgi:hypothetical protein